MNVNPAFCLQGRVLDDGWEVLEIHRRPIGSTGGHFSVGYKVRKGDVVAYLKALDFMAVFQSPDHLKALEAMLSAFNFERNLLAKCKNRKMRNVVTPIIDGYAEFPDVPVISKVYYIIFELADGDIRSILNAMQSFDIAWCFRSLHNIAVGLQQLHQGGIAHQDLKPSNVLVFRGNKSKIADLGRASDKTRHFRYDDLTIAGDVSYAPPELLYGYRFTDEFEFRFAVDMYHFGNLFFFYFSGLSASQALLPKFRAIVGDNHISTSFESDLPYLQRAFAETLQDLERDIRNVTSICIEDIVNTVKELCNPNPRRRGNPINIFYKSDQFGLQRYISKLDLLARKMELGLR